MKRKIVKQYLYKGFGFPVLLVNVPMISFEDDWAPDIHYEMLEKYILLALCQKQTSLSGDEIAFIRSWFGLTLEQFGKKLGVSAPAVKKWEDSEGNCTQMHEATEKMIRLLVLDALTPEKANKGQMIDYKMKIHELLGNHFVRQHSEPIAIDAMSEKIAV